MKTIAARLLFWGPFCLNVLTGWTLAGLLWWWRDPGCTFFAFLADAKSCPAPDSASVVWILYYVVGVGLMFLPCWWLNEVLRRWVNPDHKPRWWPL